MARIGLIDVDGHNFPNLPLMKLSAWHKAQGNDVGFANLSPGHYDRVYMSKVFTDTPDYLGDIDAVEIVRGGSGYGLDSRLPREVEHAYPDYSLYPEYDFALGWLTRGCPRTNHTFCITPKKDGCRSIKVADVSEFWNGQKEIVLLDQNLLACPDRFDLLQQLANAGAKVDYTGGLDARYINVDVISALKNIPAKGFHFAWDDPRENLQAKFELIANCGLARPDSITVYVLVNYWSTHEEDLNRIYALRELGLMPFVMVYDKQKYVNDKGRWLPDVGQRFSADQMRHFKTCQHLQRWCNSRRIIKLVPDFEDYQPYANWKAKGCLAPHEGQIGMEDM